MIVRSRLACARAVVLSEHSRELVETARFLRMETVRRREARPPWRPAHPAGRPRPQPGGLSSFRVDGTVGDQAVWAEYEEGSLRFPPLLRSHAELVVSLGESFRLGEEDVPASLTGPPGVVLATLMRAMRVKSVKATLPPHLTPPD